MTRSILTASLLSVALFLSGCDSDDDSAPVVTVPDAYEFTRDGQSTVFFGGQRDRQNMLSEIKAYLQLADQGQAIDASVLLNMYANENDPFADPVLNTSSKQLQDKTFLGDVSFYQGMMAETENASEDVAANNTIAAPGVSGLLERGNTGKTILVNEKGWEFTQLIEKGLMGSVFYHQIFNVYLSDERTGDDVENTELVSGANYTPMEHHWDEAFGYWGVPQNYPDGDPALPGNLDRFWAAYTFDRDALLNVNEPLMNAYKLGRAAIVAKVYPTKNESRTEIIELHELVTAATAVHYINVAIDNLATEDTGNLMHHLSEAYAFVRALSFSPSSNLSAEEINTILNNDLGTDADFWTATSEGLNAAKVKLVNAYPDMEQVKDLL